MSYATAPMASYAAMPTQYMVQQPVTYEAMPAEGQVYYEAAPVQYVQPAVYPISAERFAQIAAGVPLTQAEIDAMTGVALAPAVVEAASEVVASPAAVESA